MFSLILCSLFGLRVDGLTAVAKPPQNSVAKMLCHNPAGDWQLVLTVACLSQLPPPSQSDASEVVARGVIRSPHSAPPRHSLHSCFPGLGGVLFSVVFVVLRNKPKASRMHQADTLPLGQIRSPPPPPGF